MTVDQPGAWGTLVDARLTSGSFGYSGVHTFANVKPGDELRFKFGGSASGAAAYLLGSLHLRELRSDVPEPASLALLGLGLAAVGAARRRKRA